MGSPPGRALLNLSGGLDSALCMHQALASGRRLVVHHIRLASPEGRAEVEQEATDRIVAWHRERFGLDSFTYLDSSFDYGSVRMVKDANVWAFLTGVLLADPRLADVDAVIVPRHLDAFSHVPNPQAAMARSDELLAGMTQLVAGRVPRFEFPLGDMTKAEIVAALPADLMAACWWCRQPRRSKPCHRCHTCRQVDRALRGTRA